MELKRQRILVLFCLPILLLVIFSCPLSGAESASSFGLVNVGGSNQSTFGGLFVCNFTGPADLGKITQLNVYLATGGTTAIAVIYSDNNGVPDKLLAQSPSLSIEGTSGRWVSFDVSYEGAPQTTYWFGVLLLSAGTFYFASNVSGKAIYSDAVSEVPSRLTGGNLNSSEDLSINAVYTPSNGTGPTSTSQNNDLIQIILLSIAITGAILAAIFIVVVRKRKRTEQ
ncbi:MAG TPA: hypothetical protein VLV84_06345 [Candidatus Acidoferrales bacterium]|nr:hypothetical protein [Candidatus Acidoferrales bacterium]